MKCTLCGYEFNENEAQAACKSCGIMKGCKLIRCPNCNFEMPPEPKWTKYFRKPKDKQKACLPAGREPKYVIRTRRRNTGSTLD